MIEKELIEAAERDWEQTKEAERPKKTFVYAYIANHVSVKTFEQLEMVVGVLKVAGIVFGIPLLLAFIKYILGF